MLKINKKKNKISLLSSVICYNKNSNSDFINFFCYYANIK